MTLLICVFGHNLNTRLRPQIELYTSDFMCSGWHSYEMLIFTTKTNENTVTKRNEAQELLYRVVIILYLNCLSISACF